MGFLPYIILLLLLLVIGAAIYTWKKSRLNNLMHLELEYRPAKAVVGGQVDFFLHATPDKTIKANQIEGDLICRQYSYPWMLKLEDLGISGLNVGQPVTIIAFSMGRDLTFLNGTKSSFGGYLPIPPESHTTSMQKYNIIRWMVRIRVHVPGYDEAVIRQELKVVPAPLKTMIKTQQARQQAEPKIDFTPRHRSRDNVVVVYDGDTRNKGKKDNSDSSRFSFLEISDERQDN